jgi:hypothetical protein
MSQDHHASTGERRPPPRLVEVGADELAYSKAHGVHAYVGWRCWIDDDPDTRKIITYDEIVVIPGQDTADAMLERGHHYVGENGFYWLVEDVDQLVAEVLWELERRS